MDRYKLTHLVRTHNGADDEAYQCVYQCEDKDGIVGVRLSKELMKVAGRTLKQNITELGPKVLPMSEILIFAANLIARKVWCLLFIVPLMQGFFFLQRYEVVQYRSMCWVSGDVSRKAEVCFDTVRMSEGMVRERIFCYSCGSLKSMTLL